MPQQILIPQRPLDLSQLALDKERLNALRATTAATRSGTAKQEQINALLATLGGGGGGGGSAAPGTVAGTPAANLNALNQLAGPGSAPTSPGGPAAGGGQNAMNALLAADPATALQVQKFQTGAATEQRASREDTLKTTARELAQINALPANRRAQAYQDLLGRTQARGIDMEGIPQEFNQPFVDASIAAAQQAGFLEPPKLTNLKAGEALVDPQGRTVASRGAEREPPKATDVASFRKEFKANSNRFIIAREGMEKVRKASEQSTGVGDIALIFGFFKVIDPNSTIREGEFATAENTAGISQRARNLYNQAKTGERLSPEQRADFAETAQSQFEPALQQQLEREREFTGIAERTGFNPKNVIPDFIGPLRPKPDDTADADADTGEAGLKAAGLPEGTVASNGTETFVVRGGQWVRLDGE